MGKSKIAQWLKPQGLQRIRAWRAQGLTMEQTAQAMGVGGSTLRRWARLHPEIRAAAEIGAKADPAESAQHSAATATPTRPAADRKQTASPHSSSSPLPSPAADERSATPAGKPCVSIQIAPLADPYPFAREARLEPLSPEADPLVLERLMEHALMRRALGCCYATVTSELRKDPVTGEMVMTVTKRVDKEVPPDTSAQLFWLKTHAPERWRDKAGDEPATDGEVTVTFDVDEEEDDADPEDDE